MPDPSFAVQTLVRQRLIDCPDVVALVPASSMVDANARPELSPVILVGEGQTVYRRYTATAYLTLHVWVQEPGLSQAKEIVSAIVDAVSFDGEIERGILSADGFDVLNLAVNDTRYMRDPHGPYSHAIVTIAAIVKEVA